MSMRINAPDKKHVKSAFFVKVPAVFLAVLIIACALAGCGSSGSGGSTDASGYDFSYSDRDLDSSYSKKDATIITLSDKKINTEGDGTSLDGNTLTIEHEGTYIISGSLSDGQIIVNTPDDEKVQIVFDGVDITCCDNSPLLITESDKVFLTLAADSKNILTGPAAYETQAADNGIDGVIFSKADLCINGSGRLSIDAATENGIVSKDDLIITGGCFDITAAGDGIQGKDCLKIKEGSFTVSAGDDTLKSNNSEDEYRGFVLIDGGKITLSAGDDGIHADSNLTINGGEINILRCYEGLEGNTVVINNGTVELVADDDGLNAAGGNDSSAAEGGGPQDQFAADESAYIEINGGELNIDASGDGIDSNGSLTLTGGTVYLSGPTNDGNGALDYNGDADISGGTVVMTGSLGMAQNFGESSSQCSLLYGFSSNQAAGSEVSLVDSSGQTLLSYSPAKSYACVIFSSSKMKKGEAYTVCINGTSAGTATLSSVITSAGNSSSGMGGGIPGNDNNPPGNGNGAPNRAPGM